MQDTVIAFLRGLAAHNNVHRLIGSLQAAVAAQGRACIDFDTADTSSVHAFKSLVADNRVSLLVSMNVGLNTMIDNASWLRTTPAFLYMLDHPYAVFPFCDQIVGWFESVHLSHTSDSQARFADRLYPRFRTTHVLPHAAPAAEPPLPWEDRDIDVLFAGNYGLAEEPAAVRAGWQRFGPHRAAALEDIVIRLVNGAHDTLENATIEALAGDENLSAGQVCAHMKLVDTYLRGEVRWRAIWALAGFRSAVVCGDGWEVLAQTAAGGASFRGATDATEVQGLMRRAKIAVNLLPDYYDSHERMFDAAAHGCLLISTESKLLRYAFGEQAVHFLTAPEDLPDAAAYYAARPEEAQGKAQRAHAAFLAAHTWDHRAADLLSIVGAARSG